MGAITLIREWTMENPTENPGDRQRWKKEYEDPHFHDDADFEQPSDSQVDKPRQPPSRKPSRRMPPPRRRFDED